MRLDRWWTGCGENSERSERGYQRRAGWLSVDRLVHHAGVGQIRLRRNWDGRLAAQLSDHRAKVQIQPVETLLDEFVARDVVAGFVEQMLLLIFRRSEQPVKRLLGLLHWEKEIVASIQHQGRLLHMRDEVDDVHFRKRAVEIQSSQG